MIATFSSMVWPETTSYGELIGKSAYINFLYLKETNLSAFISMKILIVYISSSRTIKLPCNGLMSKYLKSKHID